MNVIEYIVIVWNLLIILSYAVDKRKAKKGKWRLSEVSLIIPAYFLGSIGAMLGMILFNHKTSKMKFRLLIPSAFILNVVSVYLISKYVLYI